MKTHRTPTLKDTLLRAYKERCHLSKSAYYQAAYLHCVRDAYHTHTACVPYRRLDVDTSTPGEVSVTVTFGSSVAPVLHTLTFTPGGLSRFTGYMTPHMISLLQNDALLIEHVWAQ